MVAWLFLLTIHAAATTITGLLRCSQVRQKPHPPFQLIGTCLTSQATPLASSMQDSQQECQQFTKYHRGLAFSFINSKNVRNEDTCLVFGCPEIDSLMLEKNNFYDYYGIYTNIEPGINATCVPKIGMFTIHKMPANFSQASATCVLEGGQLARVTSVERTTQLSLLVNYLGPGRAHLWAYVGLNDIQQEGFYVTSADEPLDCFDFLSWAPGEPKSRKASADCVALDSRQGWHVVDCARQLPFLCELTAEVTDPCAHITISKFKRRCLEEIGVYRNRQRRYCQQSPRFNRDEE